MINKMINKMTTKTTSKRAAFFFASLLLALLLSPLLLYPLSVVAGGKGSGEVKEYSATTIIDTDITWIGQPLPNPVKIVMYEIPGGQMRPLHSHFDQFCGYLLSGTLQIVIPQTQESAIFTAGDAYCEVMNVPHTGQAISKEAVRMIVFDLDTEKRFTPTFDAKP